MNFMAIKIENIRELQFFRRGEEVAPAEIFETVYFSLDALIEHNQRRNHVTSRIGMAELPDSSETFDRLTNRAAEAIRKERETNTFIALATLDSGEKERLVVSPRTNYHASLAKRPNIVHLLCPENSAPILLREARVYDGKVSERVKKLCWSWFKDHYRGVVTDFQSDQNQKDNVSEKRRIDVLSVPEPFLILGLEQAYLENVANRVTPKVKVVGADKDRLWYIRPFLPSVRDTSVEPKQITGYFGLLHGLGLVDNLDSDIAHYCHEEGNVVNIDPDFMAHSSHPVLIEHQAWVPVKNAKEWNGITPAGYLASKESRNLRTQIMENVARTLKAKSATFLDYLPKDLTSAPALKALQVRDSR